jgi:hypothetical protein
MAHISTVESCDAVERRGLGLGSHSFAGDETLTADSTGYVLPPLSCRLPFLVMKIEGEPSGEHAWMHCWRTNCTAGSNTSFATSASGIASVEPSVKAINYAKVLDTRSKRGTKTLANCYVGHVPVCIVVFGLLPAEHIRLWPCRYARDFLLAVTSLCKGYRAL